MKYVIIGGVAAGMSAAMEIYRTDEDAHIIVLERGEDYSYGQCGLPYVIGGVVSSLEELIARDVETFRETYGIDARVCTEVEEISVDAQIVRGINHQTNTPFEINYDRLLIATGTSPVFPPWEGSDLKGIHPLKTLTDAENILKHLQEEITAVTVVGGGYIGLEMAENLVELGKEVTMIQSGPQLAGIFDPDIAMLIHEKAKEKGIRLLLNEKVTGFSGNAYVESIQTEENSYETEFVLLAIGVEANTHFLEDTGIQLTNKGAIQVNAYQETNVKNIYAAGDCATHYHRIKQVQDHIPLGTTANKQGRIAGANMAGNSLPFQGIVGTSIIKFFEYTLGRTGINEAEAKALNIPYQVHTSKGISRAGYYPGGETLYMKLLSHEKTNQLLGAQIIGQEGVDKRIDVLATALYNEMTFQQLVDLDLSYSPPYNTVWDPMQTMARKTFD
ncbi:MAG TPA: FAD-dependent oxidoreductase [Bacillota bacterium]|nr:FAD-dependent oxidoreductase [Bacillota bacterium]